MNNVKDSIGWAEFTWNPITGCRRLCRDCSGNIYCYAYSMARRLKGRYGYDKADPFRPTFHGNRLLEPVKRKKPTKIFAVSMGDMFDSAVPELWRDLVFRVMFEAEQHTFMVLTKQPQNVNLNHEECVPPNLWVGVSQDGLTTDIGDIYELEENTQVPLNFLSCEPLLGPVELPDDTVIKWLIIGAQTGPRAHQPRKEWVHDLLLQASELDIPVFIKDNLDWKGNTPRPQEWPEVLA